jgi:hypothetical protein
MATTTYFEEEIFDQGAKYKIKVELGCSSFYSNCKIPSGTGEDSIYLSVNGESVVMDRATAKRFVDAVVSVAGYHGLID